MRQDRKISVRTRMVMVVEVEGLLNNIILSALRVIFSLDLFKFYYIITYHHYNIEIRY